MIGIADEFLHGKEAMFNKIRRDSSRKKNIVGGRKTAH